MKYRSALCTLNSVTQQLNVDANADVSVTSGQQTTIDTQDANITAYVKRLIYGVSGIIEADQGRTFIPYIETKAHYRTYMGVHWCVMAVPIGCIPKTTY